MNKFDVIVVGGGHAGIEACLATARLGLDTLLVTSNSQRIGYMSCNPSIGGLAKGHMVRELDVLGGEMGRVADATCIQYKRLNSGKGPAVRGTRVQSDKHRYSAMMSRVVNSTPCLRVLEGEVVSLWLEGNRTCGVFLKDGSRVESKSVIMTTGTFMNGVMHVGLEQTPGGRVGDAPSIGLSDQLKEFGFEVKRLKTGTPARLIRESIDWSKTTAQYGDATVFPFSFRSSRTLPLPQVACYLSKTTPRTHDIIRNNLHKSPMYCGLIEGAGPRYCPSIEDKIVRFSDRDSHQTFLEPEGLDSNLIYLQGISTSLPRDVQMDFLRTIPGLENVEVAEFGYAVEYDYIEPTQIFHRLETRTIEGLYLAGQINGTSGYEEAAAQGFLAGVNCARKLREMDEFVLGRDQAYMGVLVDDLVTKGTREPYRMFTSRAEHRLILREDNTIDRLAEVSRGLGILQEEALGLLSELDSRRKSLRTRLESQKVYPDAQTQNILTKLGSSVLGKSISFEELLRRPEMTSLLLKEFGFEIDDDPNVHEPVEIDVKYSGYVKRQNELIAQAKRFEDLSLIHISSFNEIRGLSTEEIEKLNRIRPRTLGQAGRISGVNPSAIQAIMIFLKGREFNKES